MFGWIQYAWTAVTTVVQTVTAQVANTISSATQTVVNTVQSVVTTAVATVDTAAQTAEATTQAAVAAADGVVHTVESATASTVTAVAQTVEATTQAAVAIADGVVHTVESVAASTVTAVAHTVETVAQTAVTTADSVVQTVEKAAANLVTAAAGEVTQVAQIGEAIAAGAVQEVTTIAGQGAAAVSNLAASFSASGQPVVAISMDALRDAIWSHPTVTPVDYDTDTTLTHLLLSTNALDNDVIVVKGWEQMSGALSVGNISGTYGHVTATSGSGFEALAFQNVAQNKIIISYVGSDDSMDWVHDFFGLGTSGALDDQAKEAATYYEAVKAANPGAEISFTGDSLGGGLAGLMGCFFDKPAITLDPGPFRIQGSESNARILGHYLESMGFQPDADLASYHAVEAPLVLSSDLLRSIIGAPLLAAGKIASLADANLTPIINLILKLDPFGSLGGVSSFMLDPIDGLVRGFNNLANAGSKIVYGLTHPVETVVDIASGIGNAVNHVGSFLGDLVSNPFGTLGQVGHAIGNYVDGVVDAVANVFNETTALGQLAAILNPLHIIGDPLGALTDMVKLVKDYTIGLDTYPVWMRGEDHVIGYDFSKSALDSGVPALASWITSMKIGTSRDLPMNYDATSLNVATLHVPDLAVLMLQEPRLDELSRYIPHLIDNIYGEDFGTVGASALKPPLTAWLPEPIKHSADWALNQVAYVPSEGLLMFPTKFMHHLLTVDHTGTAPGDAAAGFGVLAGMADDLGQIAYAGSDSQSICANGTLTDQLAQLTLNDYYLLQDANAYHHYASQSGGMLSLTVSAGVRSDLMSNLASTLVAQSYVESADAGYLSSWLVQYGSGALGWNLPLERNRAIDSNLSGTLAQITVGSGAADSIAINNDQLVLSGAGDDSIAINSNNNCVAAGSGNDCVSLSSGTGNFIDLASGNDRLFLASSSLLDFNVNQVVAGTGYDTLAVVGNTLTFNIGMVATHGFECVELDSTYGQLSLCSTSLGALPGAGQSATLAFTLNAANPNFAQYDIVVTGGTLGAFTRLDSTHFSTSFTEGSSGIITFSVLDASTLAGDALPDGNVGIAFNAAPVLTSSGMLGAVSDHPNFLLNSGFESAVLADGTSTSILPSGWSAVSGKVMVSNLAPAMVDETTIAGSNALVITGAGVVQSSPLATAAQVNTTYNLSLLVGDKFNAGAEGLTVSLLAGGSVIGTQTISAAQLAAHDGVMQPANLSFITGSTVASGALSLQLAGLAGTLSTKQIFADSFEKDALGDVAYNGSVVGWTTTKAGTWNPGASWLAIRENTVVGSNVMYMEAGGSATATVAAAAQANTAYTVSIKAADYMMAGFADSTTGASFQLYAGATLIASNTLDAATLYANRGNLQTYSFSGTTGDTVSGALTLKIVRSGNGNMAFDNVLVSAALAHQVAVDQVSLSLAGSIDAVTTPNFMAIEASSVSLLTGGVTSVGAGKGIAITGVDAAKGMLYYSLDSGAHWAQASGVSENHALLLDPGAKLYFAPVNASAAGISSAFSYRAWDQSSGSIGDYVDVTVNGGGTAFSANEVVAAMAINAVATAPTLSLGSTHGVGVISSGTDFQDGMGKAIGAASGNGAWNSTVLACEIGDGQWRTSNPNGYIEIGAQNNAASATYGVGGLASVMSTGNNYVIDLVNNAGEASNLYRDIAVRKGEVVHVEFDIAIPASVGATYGTTQVYWGGQIVKTVSNVGAGWQHVELDLLASADGTSRLEFRAPNSAGWIGAKLDNIVVTENAQNEHLASVTAGNVGNTTQIELASYIHGATVDAGEILSYQLSDLPVGASIVTGAVPGGVAAQGGVVTLTATDLASAKLVLPDTVTGEVDLTVTAIATKGSSSAKSSGELSFNIATNTADASAPTADFAVPTVKSNYALAGNAFVTHTENPTVLARGGAWVNPWTQLTTANVWQKGTVTETAAINLTKDFRADANLYFGNNDAGADGVGLRLTNAAGTQGLNVWFDTYQNGSDPAADFVALYAMSGGNGRPDGNGGIATLGSAVVSNTSSNGGIVTLDNIEDGKWHQVSLAWTAATHALQVCVDGVLRENAMVDIASLAGGDSVLLSAQAATGGAVNDQAVEFLNVPQQAAAVTVTAGTPQLWRGASGTEITINDRQDSLSGANVTVDLSTGGGVLTLLGSSGVAITNNGSSHVTLIGSTVAINNLLSASGLQYGSGSSGALATDMLTVKVTDSGGRSATSVETIHVNGGGGGDTLIFTSANETVSGGAGADSFKWGTTVAGGVDVVSDFTFYTNVAFAPSATTTLLATSFEDKVLADNTWTTGLAAWMASGASSIGEQNMNAAALNQSSIDGANVLYVQPFTTATTMLAPAAAANTTYVVSLDAACRYDNVVSTEGGTAQLYAGSTLIGMIALDNASLAAHQGELTRFGGSFTTGDTVPAGALTLKLVNASGSAQLDIDNVSVIASSGSQQDRLDLSGLLQGENASASNLVNYLHFVHTGSDTVVDISSTGKYAGGVFDVSQLDQAITLKNVDLTTAGSSDAAIIQNLLEHGKLVTDGVITGTSGADTLIGSAAGGNTFYGMAGDDTLAAKGSGNTLVGGAGNDTLTGDSDADTFRWLLGDQGSVGAPVIDRVTNFTTDPGKTFTQGADCLDLRDLLVGEHHLGNDIGNLLNYLHFDYSNNASTLHISTSGAINGGNYGQAENQLIVLQGVNLTTIGNDAAIIQEQLRLGRLLVD